MLTMMMMMMMMKLMMMMMVTIIITTIIIIIIISIGQMCALYFAGQMVLFSRLALRHECIQALLLWSQKY